MTFCSSWMFGICGLSFGLGPPVFLLAFGPILRVVGALRANTAASYDFKSSCAVKVVRIDDMTFPSSQFCGGLSRSTERGDLVLGIEETRGRR